MLHSRIVVAYYSLHSITFSYEIQTWAMHNHIYSYLNLSYLLLLHCSGYLCKSPYDFFVMRNINISIGSSIIFPIEKWALFPTSALSPLLLTHSTLVDISNLQEFLFSVNSFATRHTHIEVSLRDILEFLSSIDSDKSLTLLKNLNNKLVLV